MIGPRFLVSTWCQQYFTIERVFVSHFDLKQIELEKVVD